MKSSPNATCLGVGCSGGNVLARSEGADVRQLADLVGRLFQVPVAYAAMLGHRDQVMTRIGSGNAYWKYTRTFPLQRGLASPSMVGDGHEAPPEGADLGELKFVAHAPILTFCGHHLGVLVIADHVARPEFSDQDVENLVQMAGVLAARLELRMLASQATESQLRYEEAEVRFRRMVNSDPSLIACNEADGSCEYVNETWLKFTGRYIENELGNGWQQSMHPSHRDRVLSVYWEALQTRQPFTVEVALRRHDDVFRWMHCTGSPRFLKDASFAGFVLALTDLHDYIPGSG